MRARVCGACGTDAAAPGSTGARRHGNSVKPVTVPRREKIIDSNERSSVLARRLPLWSGARPWLDAHSASSTALAPASFYDAVAHSTIL